MGAAASARCSYSSCQAPNRGVCVTGELGWRQAQGSPVHSADPIPPQVPLTMLTILPQVLSVWMAKEDETFSMERPFTITM